MATEQQKREWFVTKINAIHGAARDNLSRNLEKRYVLTAVQLFDTIYKNVSEPISDHVVSEIRSEILMKLVEGVIDNSIDSAIESQREWIDSENTFNCGAVPCIMRCVMLLVSRYKLKNDPHILVQRELSILTKYFSGI